MASKTIFLPHFLFFYRHVAALRGSKKSAIDVKILFLYPHQTFLKNFKKYK